VARITVKSEITGAVWKVTSAAGERLSAEDPLLILESMKMEIPVATLCAGTVRGLLVKEG
jgi:acetyl-CoA carboxylase biotin carboxyl carrier protein